MTRLHCLSIIYTNNLSFSQENGGARVCAHIVSGAGGGDEARLEARPEIELLLTAAGVASNVAVNHIDSLLCSRSRASSGGAALVHTLCACRVGELCASGRARGVERRVLAKVERGGAKEVGGCLRAALKVAAHSIRVTADDCVGVGLKGRETHAVGELVGADGVLIGDGPDALLGELFEVLGVGVGRADARVELALALAGHGMRWKMSWTASTLRTRPRHLKGASGLL